MLKKLQAVWKVIQYLPDKVKSFLILILFAVCLYYGMDSKLKQFISLSSENARQDMAESEKYTIDMAEPIHNALKRIYLEDGDAENVILLTYHNSKKTIEGFSYLYLDYLTEYNQKPRRQAVKRIFDELDWMYYYDELSVISECGYIRCDKMEDMRMKCPKLYYDAFKQIDAQAVAIYPIQGIENQLGLVVVLYGRKKEYPTGYFEHVISPQIQTLASILDYNNVKRKLDD